MIGPPNRVPGAHAPQIETALAFTARGQATWADPTIPHTCSECAHWAELKGQGRCREYSARMQGRHGQSIERRQQACGALQLARGGGAMSEHDREARLERVKPTLAILKRGAL